MIGTGLESGSNLQLLVIGWLALNLKLRAFLLLGINDIA